MVTTLDGTNTLERRLQDMNANSPIVFTDGGMDTDVSWMQPRNAKSLIVVTDEGINTEVSWLQPLKANRPIEVTELGIVIDESSVRADVATVTFAHIRTNRFPYIDCHVHADYIFPYAVPDHISVCGANCGSVGFANATAD